jgi:hypothetical protein
MILKLIRMVFLFTLGYLGMVLCGGLSIIEMFKQFFQYTKEIKTKPNKLDQFYY